MSGKTSMSQEPFRVISDLGQLRVFTDPVKIRILRVLQRQQATISDLAGIVECPKADVERVVAELSSVGLVEAIDDESGQNAAYRATARIFQLFPPDGRDGVSSDTINAATMAQGIVESIGSEVISSLATWPDQAMSSDARRARISLTRVMEFNDRLRELVDEYWGGPGREIEEDPNETLRSFISLWYRFPEKP
jgi:predicted ArsR family transcriptional regulator